MTDIIQVKWDAKNTIFLDLFSIPKYQLQMVKALHPEMTDITEDDIRPVTLKPVMMNSPYNDLALLVREKLIIFVEAQSTWSINILIRILLYLAATYHDYIIEHNMFVHDSGRLDIPEPEFYVIYTGSRKIEKEVISLREDFWHNPNAKLDLLVRVIHSANKNDVIGQYIIFAHVLDSQIKIYGRVKAAVENTIRICQNEDVLREYLEGRKKEVIDVMMLLFDHDYLVEAYAEHKARIQAIKSAVEMCQDFGLSIEKAIHRVAVKFGLTEEKVSHYLQYSDEMEE